MTSVKLLREASSGLRTYDIRTQQTLRDNQPPNQRLEVAEQDGLPYCRSGNERFDALYALANQEATQNAVDEIQDADYAAGASLPLSAYQTGEKWHFVWTRDLAYALHLGLAFHDPARAVRSLMFKTSRPKRGIPGESAPQIIQDTGSGGSYPVSTDRIVWALGVESTLPYLLPAERMHFIRQSYAVLRATIDQDRVLVFDQADGLYRGEQSFLDWREQTYPTWTEQNVLPIAMSKSLSVNVLYAYALRLSAAYAQELGHAEEAERYSGWALALKEKIHAAFFDEAAGMLRAYLFSENGSHDLPAGRYDLLAQCLAIELGIVDEACGRTLLEHYPTGPHGPSVVWPQEATVAIYHNQGIWPFVTAYWVRAGKKLGHTDVVEAGLRSLMDLTAANLSNMENYDFVSGLAYAESPRRSGPVINSRRQLWSVAGYQSLVQQVVFGLEISRQGISLSPFITAWMRAELFAQSEQISLSAFPYLGTTHDIRITLPRRETFRTGVAVVSCMMLNGEKVATQPVCADMLRAHNCWVVTLSAPEEDTPAPLLKRLSSLDDTHICAPPQPRWDDALGAVVLQDNQVRLHFRPCEHTSTVTDVYRDGHCVARDITGHCWSDPDSSDRATTPHTYHLLTRNVSNGLRSHFSPARSYVPKSQQQTLPLAEMKRSGGHLSGKGVLEGWGAPTDDIRCEPITVNTSGRYALCFNYSNGAGPINTGITCAVKRLDIIDCGRDQLLAHGYLIMPQTGSWQRYAYSNVIEADFISGHAYAFHLYEDCFSRNMSYLERNETYTARAGGGPHSYNLVNLASAHLSLKHLQPPS